MTKYKLQRLHVCLGLFCSISFAMSAHAEPDWMRLGKPAEPEVPEAIVKPIPNRVSPVVPVVPVSPKTQTEVPTNKAPEVVSTFSEPAAVNDIDALRQIAPISLENAKDVTVRLGNLSGLDAFCGTVPQLTKKIHARFQSLYMYSIGAFGQRPADQLIQIYSAEQIKSLKMLRINMRKENGSTCEKFYKNFDKDIATP